MKKVEILKTSRPSTASSSRPSTASPVLTPKIVRRPQASEEKELSAPIVLEPLANKMKESVRFVTEIGEIAESISELMTSSPNFNVISAIGPQGAGKSTILSMLAGNNSRQMYREYVFRPVSREANEQSRHQTILIDIYVLNQQIFLDCQPMHGFSSMDGLSSSRGGRLDELTAMSDTIRLTAFLLFVSHTVLVVSETHFNKSITETILAASHIRPYLPHFRPALSSRRRTKLIFIKTKACSLDMSPAVIREIEETIRPCFHKCRNLKVSDDPLDLLIPLTEIRLRRGELYEGSDGAEESDDVTLNEFDEAIGRLRDEVMKKREDFTMEPAAMDSKKWLEMCREVIRDKTLHKLLRELKESHLDATKDRRKGSHIDSVSVNS